MKIRWRQYEMFLAGVIFCVYVTILLRRPTELPKEVIDQIYGGSFLKHHMPFSFGKNFLLPEIVRAMVALAFHLYINIVVLGKIKIRWRLADLLIRVVLPVLVLAAGVGFAHLLKHDYLFRSPDGNNLPIRRLAEDGFTLTAQLLVFYGAYFVLRELFIRYLEKASGRQSFRILIANQAGLVGVCFILGLAVIVLLKLQLPDGGWNVYLFFLPPAAILFFTNLYWLFPSKQDTPFVSGRVLIRWIGSVTVVVLPFCFLCFLRTKDLFDFLLFSYLFHLGVITPLSWLVYLQQKDRILELRGLQAALGRSTADLAFLRSQINPHFLFNTLNSLYGTALQESATRTAEGIQRLGDMMRFMLHENHLEKIPMAREIDYLKNYIALQQLRIVHSPEISISNAIDGQCGVDEWGHDSMITPMLLIPFVENAFKHGISLRAKSWIHVELNCEKNRWIFGVRNSIHPKGQMGPHADESGIGLENVRQRLQMAYPDKHRLEVSQTATEYVVHLSIDREQIIPPGN